MTPIDKGTSCPFFVAENSVEIFVTQTEPSTPGPTGVRFRRAEFSVSSLPDINYKFVSSAFSPPTYCMKYGRHSTLWKMRNNYFSNGGEGEGERKNKWR
jgi:hypothetical protein